MRSPAAYIFKTNGAYLIHWVGDVAADRTEDENFEAASSLAVAKRVAVAGAPSNGFSGAVRWTNERSCWILEMTFDDDDDGTITY